MNITKIMNKLIICKPKGYTYEKVPLLSQAMTPYFVIIYKILRFSLIYFLPLFHKCYSFE